MCTQFGDGARSVSPLIDKRTTSRIVDIQRSDTLIVMLYGGEKDSQTRDIRTALRLVKKI